MHINNLCLHGCIAGYSQPITYSDNGDPPEVASLGGRDEAIVWEMMGHSGGRLVLPEYGVSLTIPEGSIPLETSHKLYVGVLLRGNISSALSDRQVRINIKIFRWYFYEYFIYV